MKYPILGAAVAVFVCSAGASITMSAQAAQGGQQQSPPMSENVFKNIQVLKGIPADEFMDTMGMFASSLLFDCTGCHVQEILTNRDAFAVATPRIQRARQMVVMVNTINRNFFGGQPRVTCFTCHRGADTPEVIPDLALQYGDVADENPNAMRIFPDARVSADKVFGRYIQELGGNDRVSKLTSFIATGNYAGFNTGDAKVPIEIHAKAPNQRTQIVRTFEGDAIKTFDGRNAWAAEGWRQIPLMEFTGGNLTGARFEAIVSFPAGIQKAYSQWQATLSAIDGRNVQLLQGSNPGELPVNLYFDEESGLLVPNRPVEQDDGRDDSYADRLLRLPGCRRRQDAVPHSHEVDQRTEHDRADRGAPQRRHRSRTVRQTGTVQAAIARGRPS